MYCADNDAILIAAFVTPTQLHHSNGTAGGVPYLSSHSDVEAACVKLRDAFQSRFNGTLQQMHNTFMSMARNTDEVNTFLTHQLLVRTHGSCSGACCAARSSPDDVLLLFCVTSR